MHSTNNPILPKFADPRSNSILTGPKPKEIKELSESTTLQEPPNVEKLSLQPISTRI